MQMYINIYKHFILTLYLLMARYVPEFGLMFSKNIVKSLQHV